MGRPWTHAAGNRYLAHKALAYMAAHPWATVKISVKKALMFWGPLELTHNYVSVQYEREHSPVLRHIPGTFAAILALFMVGVALYATRGPGKASPLHRLILLFVVVYSGSYVPFFVVSQFRTPLLPFLMLFAAHGIWQLVVFGRARRFRRALGWLGVTAAAYALCGTQYVRYDTGLEQQLWHYIRFLAATEKHLGQGQYDEAMAEYELAAQGTARAFADYVDLAKRLAEHNLRDRAIEQCERAVQANPSWTWVYFELGNQLLAEAAPPSGTDGPRYPDRWPIDRPALRDLGLYCLRHFTELEPAAVAGHLALGKALTERGDADGAAQAFRKALELDPANPVAKEALSTLSAPAGGTS